MVMLSYFSANPNKITMILIAVATSGLGALREGDLKAAGKLVQDNLTMLLACFQPPWCSSSRKTTYVVFMDNQMSFQDSSS